MEATWNAQFELDLEADAQRRVRRALGFSALAHVLVVIVLMFKPTPEPLLLPAAITVDLVAAPPSVAPPAAAKPAPVAKPRPVAPPPPPQAKILPKRAPDALAKPAAKPAPVEPIRRRARPKEMELGDAMAALRNQLGEPTAESSDAPPVEVADASPSAGLPGAIDAAGTATVSPELRQWMADTIRHIQGVWVNPPDFLGRGLLTELRVELLADGTVVGSPEVLRSSGDPYADDNAVRAINKSSPLPAPPTAGAQIFIFSPEATAR